jgi:hypothetical protein
MEFFQGDKTDFFRFYSPAEDVAVTVTQEQGFAALFLPYLS